MLLGWDCIEVSYMPSAEHMRPTFTVVVLHSSCAPQCFEHHKIRNRMFDVVMCLPLILQSAFRRMPALFLVIGQNRIQWNPALRTTLKSDHLRYRRHFVWFRCIYVCLCIIKSPTMWKSLYSSPPVTPSPNST